MRITRCFLKKLKRLGMWMLPVALGSSLLLAGSVALSIRYLLAWLGAYLVICFTWWAITQILRARRLRRQNA